MKARDLLFNNNLNITESRIKILEILISSPIALSEKEIQNKSKGICDRATIYRTLKRFKDKDIIHPIVTESTITKYVIRKDPEEHLHFKCNHCGDIMCLPEVQMNDYQLPFGFTKMESNFLVIGTCNSCNPE